MTISLTTRTGKGSPVSGTEFDANMDAIQTAINSKGVANGYASLGAGALVPIAQLASGTPDGTKFVRDDGTLAAAGGGATGGALNVSATGSINITGRSNVLVFLLAGSDAVYTNTSFLGLAAGQIVSIYNSHFGNTKTLSTGIKTVGGVAVVLAYHDMCTFMVDGSILLQIGSQLLDVKAVP